MERIGALLGLGQKDFRFGGGDSYVDRLSSVHTVLILGMFSLGVMAKQWIGDVPISCWCPAHFTGQMCDYTNKVWQQYLFI